LRGETEQSEGTEKLKPKEQNRGGKLSKKEKNRDWGVIAQRRRRTVPHHLGTTVVLPLHRHSNSTS
jgi:hypothetical protein